MRRTRFNLIPLIGALALVGCLEDQSSATAPEMSSEVAVEPITLSFTAPPLTTSDLIPLTLMADEGDDGISDEGSIEGPTDDESRPLQQIMNARTKTGFYPGQAWAEGSHNYIGNVGRVETTAKLYSNGQHLADQTVVTQDFKPFVFHFGQREFIFAFAPVHTGQECGLVVRGSSLHSASWEFYQGTGASAWGEALQTSVAVNASQEPCSTPVTDTGTSSGPDGAVCYYLIYYDMDTGVILGVELLYCTASSGDLS